MNITVLILIIVLIVLFFLAQKFGSLELGNSGEVPLPYESRNYLVSKSERSFLGVLDQVAGENFRIFSKVRLEDVIKTRKGLENRERNTARNRIKSRHLDFVLCDPQNLQIIAAIELDDSSHQNSRSTKRDDFVNKALEVCEIPLIRFKAQKSYNAAEIADSINTIVKSNH